LTRSADLSSRTDTSPRQNHESPRRQLGGLDHFQSSTRDINQLGPQRVALLSM
jgi:hypothetical protein